MKKVLQLCCVLLIFGLANTSQASSNEWYIDSYNGSDTDTCGDMASPCQTFTYVLNKSFSGGDKFYFNGKFTGDDIGHEFGSEISGTEDNPTVFSNWPDNTDLAVFDMSEGSRSTALTLSQASYVVISGIEFAFAEDGLKLDQCDYIDIEKSSFQSNSERAIVIDNTSSVTIANSLIYNNTNNGIYLSQANDIDLYNNTFYNNRMSMFVENLAGLDINDLYNNIFYLTDSSECAFKDDSARFNETGEPDHLNSLAADYNNYYLTNNDSYIVRYDVVSLSTSSFRTLEEWQNSSFGLDANSVDGDPVFVDSDKGDFSLDPTSVAIDQGTTLELVTDDIRDLTRPEGEAYDIGAYEYDVPLVAPLKAKKINKLKNKNKKYRFRVILKPTSDQIDTIITKVRQKTKAGKWGKWQYKQTKNVSGLDKTRYTVTYKKSKLKYNRESQIRVRFKNDAGSSGWMENKFTTTKK